MVDSGLLTLVALKDALHFLGVQVVHNNLVCIDCEVGESFFADVASDQVLGLDLWLSLGELRGWLPIIELRVHFVLTVRTWIAEAVVVGV